MGSCGESGLPFQRLTGRESILFVAGFVDIISSKTNSLAFLVPVIKNETIFPN